MRKHLLPLFVLSLTLGACQSSVVTPEEHAIPDAAAAEPFSGQHVQIDTAQSVISFVGKSNIINHEGKFGTFAVTITPDAVTPSDFTKATVSATIDVTTIQADSEGLVGHLNKADFFDTAQYPNATFTSTAIAKTGDDTYAITGDLTVKGQTKSVVMNATVTDSALTGTFDMPRQEFGVGNDSYGNKLLEEMVPVTVKLVFLS